jgi:hypothetical protein
MKNDFVDGLERERRTVARRLREQNNDIGERLVQLWRRSMLRTSGRKFGAAAFNNTRVTAQTSLRQQRVAQISQ